MEPIEATIKRYNEAINSSLRTGISMSMFRNFQTLLKREDFTSLDYFLGKLKIEA